MNSKSLNNLPMLLALIYSFASCSKEASYPLEPYSRYLPAEEAIIAPKIFAADTILTNFYTPGQFDFSYAIDWGGDIGTLSILSEKNGIALDTLHQALLWDNSLALGIYPVIVQAENSAGKTKDTILLKTRFGGYFKKLRNQDPDSLEGMATEQPLIFNYDGYIHSCACSHWDYVYGGFTPGRWRWTTENEIIGTYDNEENYPQRIRNSKRAFKATVTYDTDTGFPGLIGVWYQDAFVAPGSEKGSIVLSMDISAWEYFHGDQ